MNYVLSIDQGTTSTRCIIFDNKGKIVSDDQLEHQQFYPKPGWVEHDGLEIWNNTQTVIKHALEKKNISSSEIAAIGITNQRETSIIWDKNTGTPVHNAIVWQDLRSDYICSSLKKEKGQDRFKDKTGLPIATYFSATKIMWLLDNVEGLRRKADNGDIFFGNMDTWLIWNLTGGTNHGVHSTDVTNASRTLLMNLETLQWDDNILSELSIPKIILPSIKPSSYIFGKTAIPELFNNPIPISGDLGDQQAATVGQACLNPGDVKNTYGTGNFMILNTGPKIIRSNNGLLTTVCYKFGNKSTIYALEGSVAITGALVQWLRDNLGIIKKSEEVEELAKSVDDNGGIYFVPAFSGLFAPYWKDDARGVIVGLTRFINKGHVARATLEATAFQTRELLDAMIADSKINFSNLKVDGGMVFNELLMQFQSDILNVPVIRPKVTETTALGAAYAAGLAVGFWKSENDIKTNWEQDKIWKPLMNEEKSTILFKTWKKAVKRTFDWIE